MTQLVKDSSWRTLRRKVVVGASSLALVAGMGVALAPSAMADTTDNVLGIAFAGATPGTNFPGIIVDDGTAASGTVTVTNKTSGPISLGESPNATAGGDPIANEVRVDYTVSGKNLGLLIAQGKINQADLTGMTASAVDATAGQIQDLNTVTANGAANTGLSLSNFGLQAVLNNAFTLEFDGTATHNFLGNLTVTAKIVEVKGVGAAGAGDVVHTLGTGSVTTTVAKTGDPVVATNGTGTLNLPATLGKAFEATIVKSYGVPAAAPGYDGTTPANSEVVVEKPVGTQIAPTDGAVGTHDGGVKYDLGNGFIFNSKTGVLSAAAGKIKTTGQSGPWKITVDNGAAASVTITIQVQYVDDAKIASAFKATVYASTLTEGYSDGTFRPTAPVTRQAFAAFAARYLDAAPGYTGDVPETNGNLMCDADSPSAFKDVANNAPFCAVIRDMANLGVINGYSDGTFKASQPITRRAIAAMLYRLDVVAGNGNPLVPAPKASSDPFNDVAVGDAFANEIAWAAGEGITDGYADGSFKPGAASSRQATVMFFDRL